LLLGHPAPATGTHFAAYMLEQYQATVDQEQILWQATSFGPKTVMYQEVGTDLVYLRIGLRQSETNRQMADAVTMPFPSTIGIAQYI
jgi:hypothetical protein